MQTCIYVAKGEGLNCNGRVEWEHAITIAGRQLQTTWAILPVCTFHHRGGGMDKRYHEWVALNRATDEELNTYSKANLIQKRNYLNTVYGAYTRGN